MWLLFIITVLVMNDGTKKIISANAKLVENLNALLDQNKRHDDDKKELKHHINELEKQLKQKNDEEVTLLREQTHQYRENIELTADMSDEDLMVWLDQKNVEYHPKTHLTESASITKGNSAT